MKDIKKSYLLRIDDDVLEKITFIAKGKRRSINSQIEYLLDQFIKEYETKNGKIIIKNE